MEDRWLSVDEITEYLGIKRDTAYKWINEKHRPTHKVGCLWKFFIAWLRKKPPPEFTDWSWDSRRSLAIKGEGEDFRRGMVAAYRRMTECMPDNGLNQEAKEIYRDERHQDAGQLPKLCQGLQGS